ncbi:MAG: hypothetical protein U9Q74_07335 [Gemmatimonadota bacterium]|nr:hypothetical protein [Gemmatimonadota bacterium]
MPIGRPRRFELTLSDVERVELTTWAQSRSLPHSLVQRAKAILPSAEGHCASVSSTFIPTSLGERPVASQTTERGFRNQF